MTETKTRKRTAAQVAAEKKYQAANRRNVMLALFRSTDADILAKLENLTANGESIQAYIKSCIRADLAK